jgi:chemotaxis methyl-accepting protein methylase
MTATILPRLSNVGIIRRCLGRPFLVLNEKIWRRLPASLTNLPPVRRHGQFLHTLVQLRLERSQNHGTYFFRNRPQLELLRRLLNEKTKGAALTISVLASSSGAEVYSILWTIRSARPDLKVRMHAVDTSNEVLQVARNGVYSFRVSELTHTAIFERATEAEIRAMFDADGAQARVKPSLKEGIIWQVGNAASPGLAEILGPQDIVVANNFLCHMDPAAAEKCLRNIARLAKPGGYLFVSGIDLDVRTKVALDLGWTPVRELLEEIHEGDPCLRRDWPWEYWGLEPLDKRRHDWQTYYAAVFKMDKPI